MRKEIEHQLDLIDEEVSNNTTNPKEISSNKEDNTNKKERVNEEKDRVRKLGKVRRHPQSQ